MNCATTNADIILLRGMQIGITYFLKRKLG